MSEILDAVRLRGGTVLRLAPEPPFAVEVPGDLRVVHLVEQGTLRLRVQGRADLLTARAGDMLLLARGDSHVLQAGEDAPSRSLRPEDCYVTDADSDARWLTGTFSVKEAAAE